GRRSRAARRGSAFGRGRGPRSDAPFAVTAAPCTEDRRAPARHGAASACWLTRPGETTPRPANVRYEGYHSLMATTANPTRDDFAALLNESLGGEHESFEGRVVKGTVTALENDMAVIDVGLKSEGRVPLREFAAPGQKADL